MEQNNFFLDLIASLKKSESKKQIKSDINELDGIKIPLIGTLNRPKTRKQIKEDIKTMGDIDVPLTGKLNRAKTKAQIKQDLASTEATVKLTGKFDGRGVDTSVQQVTSKAQKEIDSKPLEVAFSVKKEKLINDIKLLAQQNSRLFKDTGMSVKYNSLLDSAEMARNTVELSILRTQLGSLRSELKVTGNAGLTMTDTLKNGLSKIMQFFCGRGIITQFTAQLRSAWAEAKELDSALTDLSRVSSDITRDDFPGYLDRVISKTKELSVAAKDYIDAVTTFSRAGYSLADSEVLADAAVQLEKVGDMSAEAASKSLLSGLQAYGEIDGYGMDQLAEKAQALNDKIDIIGNTASITQKEVAEGIQAVGSVMSDANTSVDEFISLLAAGNRSVQDSDKVALAIRTSALRIRGCTSELAEMGETTDDVIESTSALAEKIKALTNIDGNGGVNILEADGETFRSIYDIYNDIAKVYNKMSDVDASSLLELIAGKNRSNQISAVLQNMSEANVLLERSLNAAGTASAEYEIYLNSAEAASERFGAAMTETYNNILSGETVRGLTNAGTAVLEFANSWGIVEGTLKGFLTLGILKGITTLSVAFKNSAVQVSNYGAALNAVKDMGTYAQGTRDYAKAMNTLITSCSSLTDAQLKQVLANRDLDKSQLIEILQLDLLKEEEQKARLAQLGLVKSTEAQTAANGAAAASTFSLKSAVTGLWAGVKSFIAANKLSIAIMGISAAIGVVTSMISNYNQKLEESRQKAAELASAHKEQQAALDAQVKKYQELKESLDSGNLSAGEARSVKEQLLEIQNSLVDSYGAEASNIDLVNGKYQEQLGLLTELSKEKATDFVIENRDVFEEAKKQLAKEKTFDLGTVTSWSKHSPMTQEQQDLLDYIETYSKFLHLTYKGGADTSAVSISVKADVQNADEVMRQFAKDLEEYGNTNGIDVSGILDNIPEQLRNAWTDELKEYKSTYDEFIRAEIIRSDALRPLYQQSIQAVEEYNRALSSGEGVEEAKAGLDSVQQSVQNMTGQLEGSQDVFDGIYEGINRNAEAAYNLSQAFENNESVKAYAEKLKGLSDIDLKAVNFEDSVQSPGEEAFGALINILGLSEDEVQKLIDKLVELGYVQGEVQNSAPIEVSFAIGDYKDTISDVQSSISTLRTALDSLNSGDLSKIDVIGLMQQFPDLVPYIDLTAEGFGNLSAGLSDLIAQQPTSLIKSLEELKEALSTEEERAQVDLLIDSLQRLSSYGDTGMEAYAAATGSTWDDTANVIESVTAQFENLAKVQESVADGLTMSTTKAAELAKMYPEILTNAQFSADGQVTLNEAVVKSILDGNSSIINAQIAKLEADKAELTAKKSFAEAQLNMAKQIGEGEGKISEEVARYRLDAANSLVKALIDAGMEEDRAYAAVAENMAGNTDEFNRIVGEVAQDIAVNMDDAAVSMADSIDINSINAQTSFEYLKKQAWETADAVKAAGKGERAGSAKNVRGGGSTAKGGITVYSHSGTFDADSTDYDPKTIGLDEFQSQLELDIKGYTDAISNIDSQIEVLKELQNTFKNNDGIGGHDYSNKIKQLEKEKEDINNALKDTSKESSKKETAETFNWIEKAISRVQRTVKNFGSTVSATWKNWKDRNDALISQLGEVRKEISLQQSAYQSYMNAAESVGLSDHYKSLVRNGAMSIEDITDDALKEQIKSYQEWYEKALDCADAVQELKSQLAELAKTKFNALEKQFDNAMGITTSGISSLEKQISIVEESGKIAGEAFYGAMSEYATANLEALEKKHAALSSSLQEALDSGSIEKYSDDWFEMTEAISGVEEAILDTRLSLIKYEESMKQVAKLKFDAVAEEFDKITGHISGNISILEKQISLIEESGGIAGETFYNALISQSEQNLAVLQQKYNEMEAELQNGMDSGSISMYDDNWYEMTATLSSLKGEIIDAQTATVQFRNRLKEVSMLRFDSLEGQFDNAIGLITHWIDRIEKEIAAVEEAGMIAGESYYRELTKAQEQNIQALEAKYAQLSSTLNEAVASGNVEEYSEEWYKMVNVLNSVEDAIFDARQEVLKYGESIKEIAKLKFDSLESQFSNAIGLISSDMSLIEKQMSLVEESGQTAGESFYRALMESGNEKISALKKEYEELSKAMEGTEKYSEAWYGMANTLRQIQGEIMDTETAVTRYGNSLKEVAMIRIDSIGSQFDNVLSLVSSGIDEIEAKIAIAEASGYTAGDSFYHALVAAETKNLAILEQEYNTLVAALNDAIASGSIQKYDDKWYSAMSKISAIRKAYLNAQLSIARSQKTMRDNAAESAESVRDTAKEMFDSLVKQFNGAIGMITSAIGQVEKKIALVEEAGYVAGESFYNALVEAEAAHIASLIKEYDTLSASLDTVEKYSDSWYDMVGNINSVKDALIDAETALVKYGNALRELEWDMFDRAQDAVGGLSGESDFIRELMESNREAFDRDGIMNDRGLAIQGLHAVNYDIYMRQAQEYGEAIKKINKEIAEDPGNTKLLDRYDELVKLQREAVLNAEDEKTAIKELASEGYDMLIGRVNELADARKDALKAASDLHDYEKTVSEQAADVDRLQKIILSWQGDDSEGMKSVIQKAKSDLVKAQEELSETEYDRYMADQEAMLDTFSDELNEWVDIRLDDVNGLLGEAVSATNSNGQAIRDQINADLSSVGMSVTENFDRIFGIDYSGGVRDIVSEFCAGDGGFASAVTTVNDAINNVIAKTDSVKVSMDVADSLLGDANGRIGSVGDAVNMATDAINHVHAKVDSMDSNVSSRIDSVNAGLGELDESLWDLDEAVDHVGVDIAELDKDTVEGLGDAEDAVKSVGVKIAEAGADTVSRIGDTNASLAHVNNRVEQLHNDNGALADCIIAGRFDDTQVVNKVSDVSTQVALVRQVLESISSTVSSISSGSGSQSSSGSSGSGSSYNVSSLGSYIVSSPESYAPAQKTDSYNKSRLNTETSVVDRLKYNNLDSSISERKNLFESWGGSGTYTGSAKQNEWLINQMKKRGYKNGAKEIKEDQIAITQEDGTELILSPYHGGMMTQLHKGDSVLTKEQTQTLFKLSELPQSRLREMFSTHIPDDAIANMMPGIKNVENNPVTTNNDIDVSFTMPNVTTVDDMARFLQSRRAEQIITSIVESRAMGKNRMNKYKY